MNLKEILELNFTKNNFTQQDFNKILKDIKNEIEENKLIIEKLDTIDRQVSKKAQKIEIEKIIKHINKYQDNKPYNNQNSKNIIISHYGDPYITLETCIKAILSNNKIILAIEDYRIGVNEAIVKIFTKILKNKKIYNTIFIYNILNIDEINKNIEKIDKIICVGNKNTYTNLTKQKILKTHYYPLNNIDVCYDSDKYEELKNKIYEYAVENNIEIEIYDNNESIQKNIEYINKYGENFCSVLLSEDKENIKKFKNKINSKYIYINENPFNKYEIEIPIKNFL